jgi:hypothetical protein
MGWSTTRRMVDLTQLLNSPALTDLFQTGRCLDVAVELYTVFRTQFAVDIFNMRVHREFANKKLFPDLSVR